MTDSVVPLLVDGPARDAPRLVLAHGAGAPMDSDFMQQTAEAIAGHGITVVRFEFPYMAKRRGDDRRRPPDRAAVLAAHYRAVVEQLGGAESLVIGGKSMGGRIATQIADRAGVAGVVCFGYPFHPPGKPETLRTAHLRGLRTPALIVQGERDPFGRPDEVAGYDLATGIELLWLPDGDHSLVPRVRSGHRKEGHWRDAARAAAEFVERRC